MAVPKSAPSKAASSSWSVGAVSFGERVTMRLSSWTSCEWVFCSPALNFWKRLMYESGGFGKGRLRNHEAAFNGAPRNLLLHQFHEAVGNPHRANERLAFAQAMAVGTPRDEQSVSLGDLQVMLGHGRRMLGVETFQTIHAGIDHFGNDLIRPVQTRVGHHRQSARLMNQVHGLEPGNFELGHPGRLALLQEPLEGLVQVRAESLLDKRARHMRPPPSAAIRQGKNRFGLQWNAHLGQPGGHLGNTPLAHLLEFRQFTQEDLVARVHKIAQKMDLMAADFGRQFRGGDELDRKSVV